MRARDDPGAARAERRGEPALCALRAPLPRGVRDGAHSQGEGLDSVAARALLRLLGLDAQLDRGEALLAQLRHLEPVRRDIGQRARGVPLDHRVVAAEQAVERLVRACSGTGAGSGSRVVSFFGLGT